MAAGAALIGLVPIAVRFADTGPLATAWWRYVLSAPILLLVMARPRAAASPPAPWRWRILIFAGVAIAADMACFFTAIRLTDVANATLLSSLAPVLVLLSLCVWHRRLPRPLEVAATTLAIAGSALLAGAKQGGNAGDAWALLAAVFWSAYQLIIAEARRDQPAVRVMTAVSVIAAIALAPFAIAEGDWLPDTARGWGVVCFLAIVTQVLGQGLITWASAHLAAPLSAVILLLQPVVAAVLAWVVFDESLNSLRILGGLGVLAGILLASCWPQRR